MTPASCLLLAGALNSFKCWQIKYCNLHSHPTNMLKCFFPEPLYDYCYRLLKRLQMKRAARARICSNVFSLPWYQRQICPSPALNVNRLTGHWAGRWSNDKAEEPEHFGCHFEVKFFQTQNELESFMPFPRFMLMRGSLRGNRNHSLDNPLEQDQAAAVPASLPLPLLRRNAWGHPPSPYTHKSILPAVTCVSVNNVWIYIFSNRFLFWGKVLLPMAFCRENHTEQTWVYSIWRTTL